MPRPPEADEQQTSPAITTRVGNLFIADSLQDVKRLEAVWAAEGAGALPVTWADIKADREPDAR